MFVLNKALQLKTMKTTTTRVLHSGFRNTTGCNPFPGIGNGVTGYLKKLSNASMEYLFEQQQDFDADEKHPQQHKDSDSINPNADGELYGTADTFNVYKDTYEDFNSYYRRLEDVAEEYHTQYIENLVYSISYHSNGGIIEYNKNHQAQLSLTDKEDRTVISISDLELDESPDTWSNSEVQYAMTQMPYVLKRLHNLSRYAGVHVLSYLGAYLRAKDIVLYNNIHGGHLYLKSTTVINSGFYMCNKMGDATVKATLSAKNPRCIAMFDFVTGLSNDYPGYAEDVTNFLHYAEVLNIDLRTDDLHKYGHEFIKKLVTSVITPNSQYNAAVYQSILNMSVPQQSSSTDDDTTALLQAVKEFYATSYAAEVQQSLSPADQHFYEVEVLKFLNAYYSRKNMRIDTTKVRNDRGIYFYGQQLFLIPDTDLNPSKYIPSMCVITTMGWLLKLVNDTTLFYLPVSSAIYNLSRLDCGDNKSLHKWEVLRLE